MQGLLADEIAGFVAAEVARCLWRVVAWMAVVTGLLLVLAIAAFAEDKPVPVNPLIQCYALIELVQKDRANAQTEASYFATRVRDLEEANKALDAKVKALEAKAKEADPK